MKNAKMCIQQIMAYVKCRTDLSTENLLKPLLADDDMYSIQFRHELQRWGHQLDNPLTIRPIHRYTVYLRAEVAARDTV